MRISSRLRRSRIALAAGLGAAVAAGVVAVLALGGEAALVEQLITFNQVAVEGVEGGADAGELAHRDRPDESAQAAEAGEVRFRRPGSDREISREERALDTALDLDVMRKTHGELERHIFPGRNLHIGWGREDTLNRLKRRPDLVEDLEERIGRIRPDWAKAFETVDKGPPPPPHAPLGFAPGQGPPTNPHFVEEGFRVEVFWAARTGTPWGYFARGHFHPPNLSTGFEAQHLGNRSELHGIHVRSVDGAPFGLRRLRYRVTMNRQTPAKPFSIDGFTNFAVQILVGRSFDPRRPVRQQFTAFPVGPPLGNDPALPWRTLTVLGFEYVQEVYIASSASVDLDDIAVVRYAAD
jgi:hypothetical protein